MDWADEIEIKIADEYGSHGAVLAADADGMIAAALRKAKADGEASGERKGRADGMREAAELAKGVKWEPGQNSTENARKIIQEIVTDTGKKISEELLARASQIEKGQT
jgi:hypothetical protein